MLGVNEKHLEYASRLIRAHWRTTAVATAIFNGMTPAERRIACLRMLAEIDQQKIAEWDNLSSLPAMVD